MIKTLIKNKIINTAIDNLFSKVNHNFNNLSDQLEYNRVYSHIIISFNDNIVNLYDCKLDPGYQGFTVKLIASKSDYYHNYMKLDGNYEIINLKVLYIYKTDIIHFE